MNRSVSCILGAGYSYVAGVPLARDLFRPRYHVITSERSKRRFEVVRRHYREWQERNPGGYPEQYLAELYSRALEMTFPLWSWAVEYVGSAIASIGTPARSQNPRYSNRANLGGVPSAHREFWSAVLSHTTDVAILTTNYDILAERALRHRRMVRPPSPGCYYGGLPRPQILKGVAQPFSQLVPERLIEMTGSIPLFKLHGSLNWILSGNKIASYQDMRPAFSKGGVAAIIPPIPEKAVPSWLSSIWRAAEHALQRSDVWVVCGYSAPPYDIEVLRLFKNGAGSRPISIFLMSPESESLHSRWVDIAPRAEIYALPGLPEGTAALAHGLSILLSGSR